MLSIVICDENTDDAASLKTSLLQGTCEEAATVRIYADSRCLLENPEAEATDMVFFALHPENGQETERLRKLSCCLPGTELIGLMPSLAYRTDLYDVRFAYVLVKPVQPDRLRRAVARALENREKKRKEQVLIPLRGGVERRLFSQDIQYCERCGRQTVLNLHFGQAVTPLRIAMLETLLPADAFARPHNSFLINLSCVDRINHTGLILRDGTSIPVSNQKREPFLGALRDYIQKK